MVATMSGEGQILRIRMSLIHPDQACQREADHILPPVEAHVAFQTVQCADGLRQLFDREAASPEA